MKKTVLIVAVFFGLTACGATSSIESTCALGPEFESSVVAANAAFDDFSKTSPRQLQSTMSVLLLSVAQMKEVATSGIADALDRVERSYGEVSIALQSIGWDTAIADSDPLVAQSLQVLSRADLIEAMSLLRDFFAEDCKTDLKSLPSRQVLGATTLPAPATNVDPDTFEESSSEFDSEESALRAYGLYVAEQIGEVVTDEQALCLGGELVTTAEMDTPLTAEQYESFVIEAIARCVG